MAERESKAKARAQLAAQKDRERQARREAEKLKRTEARERRMSFNTANAGHISEQKVSDDESDLEKHMYCVLINNVTGNVGIAIAFSGLKQ
jgi:hypothetical protein